MSEKAGKDLLLKKEVSTGVYETMAGLRSKSVSMSADGIEVTNHDSNQFRTFLDGAGIRSMSLSGSGVFKEDQTLNQAHDDWSAQTLKKYRVIDDAAGKTFEALFKITTMERAGEYNGEQTWSVTLESSGEITIS